jgi:xanthine/uracil permease
MAGNYDRLATHAAHATALIISLLAAIFACLVHWLHLAVPPLETGFVVLLLSYLVLPAGNVFRGL